MNLCALYAQNENNTEQVEEKIVKKYIKQRSLNKFAVSRGELSRFTVFAMICEAEEEREKRRRRHNWQLLPLE